MNGRAQVVGLEGFVYLIEFSTNRIKPGLTEDPQRRLSEHRVAARCYGTEVERVWLSPPHVAAPENEALLLAFCRNYPGAEGFGEFFADVPYDKALAVAQSLPFERSEQALREERMFSSALDGPCVAMGVARGHLDLSRAEVVALIHTGELQAIRGAAPYGHYRISRASIEDYIARNTVSSRSDA